jgi:ureidoglycolate lyase
MKTVVIKVEELSNESFKPYGDIIDRPNTSPDCCNEELALWCGISAVEIDHGIGQFCWLDVKSKRPFICNNFECHKNTSEAMIPISGQSIVLVAANNPAANLPDRDTIKAFFVDGTKGFNFKPGVWHWLPYPLSNQASFILVFKKDTPDEDLYIVDLNEKLDLSIKINL